MRTFDIECPDAGPVRVRALSVGRHLKATEEFERLKKDPETKGGYAMAMFRVAAASLCDSDGKYLYDPWGETPTLPDPDDFTIEDIKFLNDFVTTQMGTGTVSEKKAKSEITPNSDTPIA